jgi:DNA-binding MurR/RpiR family transcriptional regulator
MEGVLATLTPAERRVALFIAHNKQAVLLNSAAQIAELAGTSDASVVRTARSLGYDGLTALREALLADLTGPLPPDQRLMQTLDEAGDRPGAALDHAIGLHQAVIEALKRPAMAAKFDYSLEILGAARRRHVFGIGPSGALADYAVLQFNRIGFKSHALSMSGVGLADRLLWLEKGDAVLIMAYAPLYREVDTVLGEARALDIPVVLVSDSLGPLVSDLVAAVLPVPRGRADHLAMHSGTMVLIEAMIIGLAARQRSEALVSLGKLSRLRSEIDRDWVKRGVKRK